MNQQFLGYFWDLASEDSIKRQNACINLIEYLHKSNNLQVNESLNQIQMQTNKEIQYCMKRLIRGLCSSREAARQGFAITLIEIMNCFQFPIQLILQLIQENLQVSCLEHILE